MTEVLVESHVTPEKVQKGLVGSHVEKVGVFGKAVLMERRDWRSSEFAAEKRRERRRKVVAADMAVVECGR